MRDFLVFNMFMDMIVEHGAQKDISRIGELVKEFRLDDEDIKAEQFLVVKDKSSQLLGFGRLRTHTDCIELCTLGVVAEYRGRGIGKMLVNALAKKANADLYVVCIIPGFFEKFGFEIVEEAPSSIERKVNICTTTLVVEESYFSMKLARKITTKKDSEIIVSLK